MSCFHTVCMHSYCNINIVWRYTCLYIVHVCLFNIIIRTVYISQFPYLSGVIVKYHIYSLYFIQFPFHTYTLRVKWNKIKLKTSASYLWLQKSTRCRWFIIQFWYHRCMVRYSPTVIHIRLCIENGILSAY